MDKTRLFMAIGFMFATVILTKLIIAYIENLLKEIFKEKSIKIISIFDNFYFLFNLGFALLLCKTFPLFDFNEIKGFNDFFLEFITYISGILMIYHWLFKTIINKIIDSIKTYNRLNNTPDFKSDTISKDKQGGL